MTRSWIQSNTSSVSPQRLFAVLCGHSPTQPQDVCCRVGVNMGRVAVKVNSPLLLELETEKAQSSLTKDPGTPVAEHCSQSSLVEDEVMRSTTPECDPGTPENQETSQPEEAVVLDVDTEEEEALLALTKAALSARSDGPTSHRQSTSSVAGGSPGATPPKRLYRDMV